MIPLDGIAWLIQIVAAVISLALAAPAPAPAAPPVEEPVASVWTMPVDEEW
jgi:hypothetical protein